MNNPNCYIIAGSNGAGKTTFALEFLPRYVHCTNFVNPDLIAHGLSPFNPDAAMIHAGRLVLEQIQTFAKAKLDFAFETTLSGRTYLPIIKQLRAEGYRIHLFYLWLPDVELALSRIRDRVKLGGHNVQERDVRRRFRRTFDNLRVRYMSVVDHLQFFDNAASIPYLIYEEIDGLKFLYDEALFKSIFLES